MSGYYIISSMSSLSLYGLLYEQHFNPYSHKKNLLHFSKHGCYAEQFRMHTFLPLNTTYILVISPSEKNRRTHFSIIVSGSENIIFKHIRKFEFFLHKFDYLNCNY